jgi:hypothetical protein
VAGITGYIFCLHDASRAEQQQHAWDIQATMQPSTMEDLLPMLAALREHGPVTSLPLPHYVHDSIAGWLPTRPRSSPTLPVQFRIDRSAYAQLQVPLPRMSLGRHPGHSGHRDSVPDSDAEVTILPQSTLQAMSIKEDTTFPCHDPGQRSKLLPHHCERHHPRHRYSHQPQDRRVQEIQAACLYLLTCPEAIPQLLH